MMKKTSDKTKHAVRFGLIDIAILLAVLACIAAIFLRFNFSEKFRTEAQLKEAEISFLISDLHPVSAEALLVGDTYYWDENRLGTLKSFEISNAEAFFENDEGLAVRTENLNRRDVRGIFTVQGKQTDEGFLLNGSTYIAPGKSIVVRSQHLQVYILVTDVSVIGG